MGNIALAEIEETVQRLPPEEQLWLISRLAENLRRRFGLITERRAQLQAMAEDEYIQRELRAIDEEFRHTEGDGLADL
jgi:hypothetical protein